MKLILILISLFCVSCFEKKTKENVISPAVEPDLVFHNISNEDLLIHLGKKSHTIPKASKMIITSNAADSELIFKIKDKYYILPRNSIIFEPNVKTAKFPVEIFSTHRINFTIYKHSTRQKIMLER